MKKATKKEIQIIRESFLENYSNSITELNFESDYQLLIAIILSAQCTDKRVNIISPSLFQKYPTTKDLSIAKIEDVKKLIQSCSFFNNKAKNIISMAKSIEEKHNGKIPQIYSELISLAGVGNKTANVFMIEFCGANLMAVDTHVFRVSHRLGLSDAKNVDKTEIELVKKFKTELNTLHQAMVLFGRYICKAVSPQCEKCLFPQLCKTKTKKNYKPS